MLCAHIERSFRLTNEPGGLGLSCTASGLSLAGVPLLRKSGTDFVPRSATEIEALVEAAYRRGVAAIDLVPSIDLVARALNRGEMARAMTAAVLMRLPELDWNSAARLAHAEDQIRKYDPNQPRDWHGRWTTGDAIRDEARENPVDFASNGGSLDENPVLTPIAPVASEDSTDPEAEPPDDRPPLERKYDDLGPVEFSKQVIQFGLALERDGKDFSPEQREAARAEYNFLQDRLNFWQAYADKPLEAEGNINSAATILYHGAVLGGIVPVGGKGGGLPASMLVAATSLLAADNGGLGVRVRGRVGGGEAEPEAAPSEPKPAPSEEESVPSRAPSASEGPSHIIEELTRTGELSEEVVSSEDANIGWDRTTKPGLQFEDFDEIKYPELRRLPPGAKTFDFFHDVSGEALSNKAIDPLCYSYIKNPQKIYSKVEGYIDAAASYRKPRASFDLEPGKISSKTLRLAVHDYISPTQWESLYRAVLYARSRGVKIIIRRFN
jgi:hypothetical protein